MEEVRIIAQVDQLHDKVHLALKLADKYTRYQNVKSAKECCEELLTMLEIEVDKCKK